jgi:flagellar L-ring protein precursor FlgH
MTKRSSLPSKLGLICASAVILAAAEAPAQSLWKQGQSRSMFADKRASAVGDIVTIVVQENNTASKDNSTTTSKTTSVNDSISSFLYPPSASGLLTKKGQLPALAMNSANNFSGGGKIANSETITAQIAVRVIDVLPNGNLVIEGHKQTSFAGESQDAVLRGVIRQADISAANTIYSYNVADASIRYVTKGAVTDNQKRGWFTGILDKINPF